jgi:hypothetical protein
MHIMCMEAIYRLHKIKKTLMKTVGEIDAATAINIASAFETLEKALASAERADSFSVQFGRMLLKEKGVDLWGISDTRSASDDERT